MEPIMDPRIYAMVCDQGGGYGNGSPDNNDMEPWAYWVAMISVLIIVAVLITL